MQASAARGGGLPSGTVAKYREAGLRSLMRDDNVRTAVYRQTMRSRAASAAVKGLKSEEAEGLAAIGRVTGVGLGGMMTR